MGVTAAPPERALVIHHPAASAPAGYIKANGALISRTAYAWLFGKISTTFGVGDGSTTFAIPDLRGEFIRGLDDGRAVDTGRVLGSAQGDLVKAHTHGITNAQGLLSPSGSNNQAAIYGLADNPPPTPTITANVGVENRPRNVALLACIAYAP